MAKLVKSTKRLPGGKIEITWDDNSVTVMTEEEARKKYPLPTPSTTPSPSTSPSPSTNLPLKPLIPPSPSTSAKPTTATTTTTVTAGSYDPNSATNAFTDPTTGQSVAGGNTVPTKGGPKTVAELVMQARNPKNLAAIRKLLLDNGLITSATRSISSIQNTWLQVVIGAQTSQMDPEDYVKQLKAGGFGADTTGAKTGTTEYPSVYSTTQADAKITDVFNKVLGRAPTQEELTKFRPELIAAQKKNPATQVVKKVGGKTVQSTVGGLDEEQWLTDKLNADAGYKAEIEKGALTSKDVAQRAQDKAAYDKAIAAAKGDKAKIDEINRTSNYGLSITALKNTIKADADAAGAAYDEAFIDQLAKEAYDTNQDVNRDTLTNFLQTKFKFGIQNLKGKAADSFNTLKETAIANGIDLQKAFGSQLPSWLEALNKGGNIEDFKKTIRDVAKIGMPEKVAKLMDQGIDLQTIYSPYQNLMENVLEVPRGSVTLDDPTLRAAITAEGEIPLYQFERDLRKDTRWQFTKQAKEEVSSAVLGILRDFGFQG